MKYTQTHYNPYNDLQKFNKYSIKISQNLTRFWCSQEEKKKCCLSKKCLNEEHEWD